MRIAYDVTSLRPPQTGVGYYTEHLLRHMASLAPEEEFVLVSNRPPETSRPLPGRLAEGRGFRFRSVWMQFGAPALLRDVKPDLAHFTNASAPLRKTCPTVATIHDMSLTLLPRHHPARRLLTRPLVHWTALNADLVIAVSHSARRDISRLTGRPESAIRVVHSAAAPEFRPLDDDGLLEGTRRRYGLDVPFLLFVGTLEPRKNLPALISAFHRFAERVKPPHQLVLAGAPGWGRRQVQRQIRRLGAQARVRELGYVPFADLPALYCLADAFVFPSIHEGFGLPILEAMACGTPVIASDVSSMKEIAGGAVEGVDPLEPVSIERGLERVLTSPQRRAELRELGLRRCRQFSWERAAAETLEAYRSVLR